MSIFQNNIETRENHRKDSLKTRYYRNSFDQIVKVLKKLCEEEDMEMQNIDKRYGDVYMIGDGFEIMAQIIQITPIETAVDFRINYFSTFGWGRPEKKAVHLYDKLNESLTLRGTQLHP